MRYILQNDSIIARNEAVADIDDRGYQFGDGIYEVVRLYDGRFFLLHEHLVRLRRSANELGIPSAFVDALPEKLEELARREEIGTGTVYMQVTRGVHKRIQEFTPADLPVQLIAYAKPLERPVGQMKNGVKAALVEDIRWLRCDIKSLNLLGNILARQKAKEQGCFEAIQHRAETVTEGAFSNIFRVSKGSVWTHPAGNLILSGITRAHVLDLCREGGIAFREEAFTVEQLLASDEVFMTSTSSEVTPVVEIGGRPVAAGQPGPVSRRLQALYEESALGVPR